VSVSIRAAVDEDVEFLVELYSDEDVRPFLAAAGSYDRDGIAERSARTRRPAVSSSSSATGSPPALWHGS